MKYFLSLLLFSGISLADEVTTQFCQVQVGIAHYAYYPQCPMNEVVVGAYNNYLLCAPIQVVCPNKK